MDAQCHGVIVEQIIECQAMNDGLFFDASAIEPQQIRIVFEKIFTATDQIQHYNMMMNVR